MLIFSLVFSSSLINVSCFIGTGFDLVFSMMKNSGLDTINSGFFFAVSLTGFIFKLLVFEDIFNNFDLNFLLLIFDFKHIFATSLIAFNFKNFFFFGLGAGLGIFLINISTILLHFTTFLNLLIFFIGFLLLFPLFLLMNISTTLLEIDIFLNLLYIFLVVFFGVFFLFEFFILFLLLVFNEKMNSLFFIIFKLINFFNLSDFKFVQVFDFAFIDLFLRFFLSKDLILFCKA